MSKNILSNKITPHGADDKSFEDWLVGFTDGEGCFCITFQKKQALTTKLEVRPSFSVSQNSRSLDSLKSILGFFKVGAIRISAHDGTHKYETRSLTDLKEKVIPFFLKNPLRTTKQQDFEKFHKICILITQNQHRNGTGLKEIITIAYTMNNYTGKRKYTRDQLLTYLDELNV